MGKLLPLLLACVLTGCNDTGVKIRLSSLDDAVQNYANAMRWGRYEDAQTSHLTRDGQRPMIEDEDIADVRVTHFVIRQTDFNEDKTEAKVSGQYKYYLTSSGMVRTIPFEQDWWYKEEDKRWFVANGPPDFHQGRGR